jgi:multicomponent Na+:H+ antiporter subunit G
MVVQHALAIFLVAAGVFFLLVAAIGFIRLPDVFCRLHVNGVVDTLGAPLVLLGAAVYQGPQLLSLKLVIAVVLLILSSPLVGHLLARAALEAGHRPGIIENPDEFARVLARREQRRQEADA